MNLTRRQVVTLATIAAGTIAAGTIAEPRRAEAVATEEPLGLKAYAVTITAAPGTTYGINHFFDQLGKYILLDLGGSKTAIGQVKTIQINNPDVPGSTATFTVICSTLSTQGALSDFVEVPIP